MSLVRLPYHMEDSITPSSSPPRVVQVVRDYSTRLFRFIRGKVRSDEDAEDILQDVWYQLSRSMNMGEIEQMSGWLYQVARNKIVDRYRKHEPALLEDTQYGADGFNLQDILLSDMTDPVTSDLQDLFWQELFVALEELPPLQKAVFVEHELEGKTLQQIADEGGEKLKTIISRKGYAVKHLRQRLASLYNEFLSY